MSNFGDVGQFHHKFGLPSVMHDGGPIAQVHNFNDPAIMGFREKFMAEELDEFREGMDEGDVEKVADALVDLVYVAMGTAHFLGLPWELLWREVQAANMRKVRGSLDGSQSKRHSPYDVIKPEGWQGPDHKTILRTFGWDL